MNKILEIKVKDSEFESGIMDVPNIHPVQLFHKHSLIIDSSEIGNIIEARGKSYISEEEFDKAIDTLIIYFSQERLNCTTINIETWNRNKPKEMTIEDIEDILGYKIKIVKKDEREE